MHRLPYVLSLLGCLALSPASLAQQAPSTPATPQILQRLQGVWVEGPGYDIKYGADYETCAKRCAGEAKCLMIEYYRPEKKCNMYDVRRPTKRGGSSGVAVKAL
jgi:hypothetical protein